MEGGPVQSYLHDICLCNRDTGEIFYDKLGFIYIELGKFIKADNELETELDKWLYVLKNMSQMDKIPLYLRKPVFEKLFSIAEYTNLTKEEKMMWDENLKRKWDNESVMEYAVSTAEARGMELGEHKKAVEVALAMKKKGWPLAQIAEFTKLSIEEVEELK